MLDRIDEAIIRRAFLDLRRWEAAGYSIPQISLNVSKSFLEAGGSQLLVEGAASVRARVSMELLESSLLDQEDTAILEQIAALRNAGLRLEIDDFGSGRASVLGC